MVGGGAVHGCPTPTPTAWKDNFVAEESMNITSITITRTLQSDGQMGIQFSHTPETISFVETLGMLSAAQWHLFSQMAKAYGD
jgi:hypothetical protein